MEIRQQRKEQIRITIAKIAYLQRSDQIINILPLAD